MVALITLGIPPRLLCFPFHQRFAGACGIHIFQICWIVIGGLILVLGIIAIAGGFSAIRRKSFGLALAGAICALPSVILGILAVIFVSLGKREF